MDIFEDVFDSFWKICRTLRILDQDSGRQTYYILAGFMMGIICRFYIMLRSAEQTVDNQGNDKLRSDTLKFGFTEKVLNSGIDFEVPDIVPEDMEEESAFIQDKLWVEKYAPHTYADLISDEVLLFFFDMIRPIYIESLAKLVTYFNGFPENESISDCESFVTKLVKTVGRVCLS